PAACLPGRLTPHACAAQHVAFGALEPLWKAYSEQGRRAAVLLHDHGWESEALHIQLLLQARLEDRLLVRESRRSRSTVPFLKSCRHNGYGSVLCPEVDDCSGAERRNDGAPSQL